MRGDDKVSLEGTSFIQLRVSGTNGCSKQLINVNSIRRVKSSGKGSIIGLETEHNSNFKSMITVEESPYQIALATRYVNGGLTLAQYSDRHGADDVVIICSE